MGSEPGMGWNWITSLAHYCNLHVITEGEYRLQIEEWLRQPENEEVSRNIRFYYNPVPERVREMCWNQGDWRFYHYYKKWQQKTAEIAREICRKERIDILHQLNMIGFREPGYLWKVSRETGIPFVWGPVDAKEAFPIAYTQGASFKTKLFLMMKNAITKWQLGHKRRVRKAAKTAAVVLSASSNSVKSFRKYLDIDSPLMNETGASLIPVTKRQKEEKTFDILWVGKTDFRKQLALTIKAVATAFHDNIRLHIVGSGDMEAYLREAEKQGIADQCVIHGSVSHDEVLRIMGKADIFLFTSVAEGTPHVVLEAISMGLPVVCFDTCGQGDCVTDDIGIKIPLTTPDQSVKDFAERIEYLYKHREVLTKMSENCKHRAEELSWERKAKEMISLYNKVKKEE